MLYHVVQRRDSEFTKMKAVILGFFILSLAFSQAKLVELSSRSKGSDKTSKDNDRDNAGKQVSLSFLTS